MRPATETRTDERVAQIAEQLLSLLERASRRRTHEYVPGMPGAKRPEEEILVAS